MYYEYDYEYEYSYVRTTSTAVRQRKTKLCFFIIDKSIYNLYTTPVVYDITRSTWYSLHGGVPRTYLTYWL